jgi:GT2 family glycosyltransferase
MPRVSIIIVDYNGQKDTEECLVSLKTLRVAQDTDVSIIVVDNGSKEPVVVDNKKLPAQTTILRSDKNLGFTEGNNFGLRYALEHCDPDFVLLLNNDTIVDANFLQHMVQCAQANPQAGMICPKIYFAAGHEFHKNSYDKKELGKVLWYAGGSIDWLNLDSFHRGVDEIDRGQFDHQKTSEFATGCCVLLPRKVIDQVKLFDQRYFLYFEDADLSMRIFRAGYQIMFCSTSTVWHKNAGSTGGSGSALQQYYQTRNRLFFFLKYGNWRTRATTLRLGLRFFLVGSASEKRGALDWFLGQMGKQLAFGL